MADTPDEEMHFRRLLSLLGIGAPLVPGGYSPMDIGVPGLPILDATPAPPGTKLNEAPSLGKLMKKG